MPIIPRRQTLPLGKPNTETGSPGGVAGTSASIFTIHTIDAKISATIKPPKIILRIIISKTTKRS